MKGREAFPHRGARYWLFDIATVYTLIVSANYLINQPSNISSSALSWVLSYIPVMIWGYFLTITGLLAMTLSYTKHVFAGCGFLIWGSGTWALFLYIGWVESVFQLSGFWGNYQFFASATLYAFFASNAVRIALMARDE